MDIMVEGKASKLFKPDMVRFDINFFTKMDTYEKALNEGVNDVEIFINNIIINMGIDKNELKTRSFCVTEVTKYDYERKQSIKDGFSYSQSAILRMDYDIKKVGDFMDAVSKLKNPPKYRISFEVKNEEKAKSLVIAEAYSKAEEKAKMIAFASGKKLKDCIKVDFRPFYERVISNSNFDSAMECASMKRKSMGDTIQNIFTPEDVEISETLYCLWITE